MAGGIVKVPKHEHEKTFRHPLTGKFVCWCKYPFSIDIRKMKLEGDFISLTAVYEAIQKTKLKPNAIPLDTFIKTRKY